MFPTSVAIALLSACGGGGGGGGGGSPTTYQVSATAGAGGAISPANATVNAGGTTTFTLTPKSGYTVSGVTGCGGTLAGSTYTTGVINAACTVTASFAGAFTWVGGSNTTDAPGVYGTQGVTAPTNVPGARDAAVTWTDTSGNLWMFGGFAGYAAALDPATGKFLNDLWKYSPSSGQWTWVNGTTTSCSQGVYGTQGMPAPANVPGGRVGGATWTDASGNLWMSGGGGCDAGGGFILFDDVWEYSTSSGQWTWVKGSASPNSNPVYGTQGVPAAANTPGARVHAGEWRDANGNIWLFGGVGTYGGAIGAHLNDLWEYLPSSNQWAWMGGPNTGNGLAVYGTKGVAAAANVPGGRFGSVNWTDTNGNFWLFGGYGYDSTGQQGLLNDLWEFSTSTGEWTWIGGANTANAGGVYGAQGVAAAANVPPGRDSAAGWMDTGGNFWLFGGEGYDVPTHFYHRFNDLWKYSPSSGQWTWVAGSTTFDATGVYGVQGVAATTNIPGARGATSTWLDGNGSVWLFGGYQYDDPTNTRFEMNDLWKYPTQ